MENKLVVSEKPFYKSKKFLTAAFTLSFIVLNKTLDLGIDEPTMGNLVEVAVWYIVGQGLADAGKNKNILAPKTDEKVVISEEKSA